MESIITFETKDGKRIKTYINGKYSHTSIKVKSGIYKKWGKNEFFGETYLFG